MSAGRDATLGEPTSFRHRRRIMHRLSWLAVAALAVVPTTATAAIRSVQYDAGVLRQDFSPVPGLTIETRSALTGVLTMSDAGGRKPLVVVMHGRHEMCEQVKEPAGNDVWHCPPRFREVRSYAGYGYLARSLARRGYAVLSVDVNSSLLTEDIGIPSLDGEDDSLFRGMRYRAEIARETLRRLAVAADGGPNRFSLPVAGRIDFERIALVGHSRGGEGVVNLARGGVPGTVRGIVVISPVDFERLHVPADIPFASIISYCDGDVFDQQGLIYYDDARTDRRSAPLYQLVALGANHNFFNRIWPDELGPIDPGGPIPVDPDGAEPTEPPPATWCTARAGRGGGRLTRGATQRLAIDVIGTFVDATVSGDGRAQAALARRFGADGARAPRSVAGAAVVTAYRAPSARVVDIDRGRRLGTNTLGGTVTAAGLRLARCRTSRCGAGPYNQKAVSRRVIWATPGGVLREDLGRARDLTRFTRLTMRVGQGLPKAPPAPVPDPVTGEFPPPEPIILPIEPLAFSIRLVDARGRSATVRLSGRESALRAPLDVDHGPVLGTLTLPLHRFAGIDRRRVRAVEFVFDGTPAGTMLLTDLGLER